MYLVWDPETANDMSQSLRSSHHTIKLRSPQRFLILSDSELYPTSGETGRQIGRAAEFLGKKEHFSNCNKISYVIMWSESQMEFF